MKLCKTFNFIEFSKNKNYPFCRWINAFTMVNLHLKRQIVLIVLAKFWGVVEYDRAELPEIA